MPRTSQTGRRIIVQISNDAFLMMAFSAAEAAIVTPEFQKASYKLLAAWEKERGATPIRKAEVPPTLVFSETGHEVGGVLFGRMTRERDGIHFSAERALTTSAIASDDGLAQSDISPSLLADLSEAAGEPWGTVIADWHAHPLLDALPRDIEAHQLYSPSELDLEGTKPPHCEVSVIITVAWAGRSKPKNSNSPGLVYRRIGDFAFYVTVFSRDDSCSVPGSTFEISVGT